MSQVLRLLFTLSLCFFITLLPVLAFAQEAVPATPSILGQVMGNFPAINAWLFATLTFFGILLRIISDLIAFIALQLDKSDKGWAAKLAEWSMWCAKAIGWLGAGKSKRVLEWYSDEPAAPAPASPPTVGAK